jgi:hypothetical protein
VKEKLDFPEVISIKPIVTNEGIGDACGVQGGDNACPNNNACLV